MNIPCGRKIGTPGAVIKHALGALAMVLMCDLPALAQRGPSDEFKTPPAAIVQSDILVEPSSRHFIPRTDLEDWIKQAVGAARERGQLVGAGIALIRPEGPALSRGFGSGDIETGDTVHPGITYFPASGIGNLLVAQMLIDLEAKNRLDLDAPADNYFTRLSFSPRHAHLSIRDLFKAETGLTSSLRGSHLYKDQIDSVGLSHIKALMRRRASGRQANMTSPPLAAALASIVAEDVSGRPVKLALEERLKAEWNATAWFNTVGAGSAKYISRDHRILPDGEVHIAPLYAAAPGFEASRGLYLTVNDMAHVLSSQLKGLGEHDPGTREVIDLAFQKEAMNTAVNGQPRSVQVLELRGDVGAHSLHAMLVPELEIGFLAVVNSSARRPALTQSKIGDEIVPVLTADDLVESFMTRFIALPESTNVASRSSPGTAAGTPVGSKTARNTQPGLTSTVSPHARTLRSEQSAKPLFQRSSVGGLTALFLMSAVLQFALLASARWEASTTGQKITRGLGMVSVVFMTATLTFPVVLVFLEHSETLVDPLFLISQWSFPVATLMALATMVACLIGWKNGFWGNERAGFHKRLCFTVGSAGVLGLAIVTWQLDLVIPVF